MIQLPPGWTMANLEEVFAPLEDGRTMHHGWSPQCEKEPSGDEATWGVLKTTAVQPGEFLSEHNKRLPDKLTPRPLLEVQSGDVLITSAGPRARCGVTCLVRDTRPRLMLSGKMYRFRPDEALTDPRYLEAYLLSDTARLAIDRMKTGISDSGLNLTHARFRKLPLPIAPLNEQRRIVAAIEEQFSRLDAAEHFLDLANRRVRTLAGAVLRNLIDESEWPRSPLTALAEFVTDGDHNPPRRVAEGVPHLTAKNVKQGRLKTDGCTFVTEEGFNQTRRRYEPRAGDVIVTCVGTIGETAVVPEGLTFSADRNLAAIRLADGHEPSYVRLALSSPLSRRVMGAASGSTAQPHLYLRDLRALSVPVPPPDEQRRIAAEIERSMSVINAVRGVIDVAQRRSNSLRRSILERAFCGELVPQDPTDEPASILLERIHAEQPVASGRRRVSA